MAFGIELSMIPRPNLPLTRKRFNLFNVQLVEIPLILARRVPWLADMLI